MRCTNWDGLSGVLNKLSERTAAAAVETFIQLPKYTRNTLPDGVKITYLIISHLLSFCPNLSVDNFSYWYCASLLTLLAKAEGKNHLRLTFSLASITGFPSLPSFSRGPALSKVLTWMHLLSACLCTFLLHDTTPLIFSASLCIRLIFFNSHSHFYFHVNIFTTHVNIILWAKDFRFPWRKFQEKKQIWYRRKRIDILLIIEIFP